MELSNFQIPFRSGALHGSITSAASGGAPRALALHGGGRSTRQGFQPLLTSLAERGFSSASFDFHGHGESVGSLADSSLQHRAEQVLAVAEGLQLPRPVSLIASSMGGHVACSLIAALAPSALVLYCPAAYEDAAQTAPFGPSFQAIIRATTSFSRSPAFDALEKFEGRLLLVLGTEDAVIPKAVEHEYATRARMARRVEILRLEGAGHHLHAWLSARPSEFERVASRVLATLEDRA
ncbi:MAG: alpha/beta hydrolase [Variovorax sp.]|nr:MAG: alpha/beta hydrolase [Variovorax sp.]